MRSAATIAAALATILLGGCFTGIESTPRIGSDEVRRNHASAPSQEAMYMNVLQAEAPRHWQPGQTRFRVDSTARLSRIFTPASAQATEMDGRTLTFAGLTTATSLTGDTVADVALVDRAGNTFYYRTTATLTAIDTLSRLDIPFMVNESEVAMVDSLLRGSILYVRTPLWYDGAGHPVGGLRHVEVIVDSVAVGNSTYPAAVYFTVADSVLAREAGIDSGDRRMLFMTTASTTAASRNFDKLFAFDNPRRRYPDIAPDKWEMIIRSRVTEGMSRDECRLALGTPDEIVRIPTRGSMRESWTYSDGVYLVFDDGFLTRFRK